MPTTGTVPLDEAAIERIPRLMSSERLRRLAVGWRDMARYWASLANGKPLERAERLRVTAQAALHAAWRAEDLVKRRASNSPRSS